MTTTLIVDDRRFIADAYRQLLTGVGHDVLVEGDPAVAAEVAIAHGVDLALVDLSFPDHEVNGLDVLVQLHSRAPGVPAAILTQADAPFQEMLRYAWDALPLAGALSKDLPPNDLLAAVRAILAGTVFVDPLISLYLPSARRPERALACYDRLIGHAGHAELWRALATSKSPPDYRQLAGQLGKKHNTIKNYRDDLANYLLAFGLDDVSSLVELHGFARDTRPFLLHAARPYLSNRKDSR